MSGPNADPNAEERDALLERVALGEMDMNDPSVLARAEQDPDFARALAEIRAVLGSLNQLSDQARADIAAADEIVDAPGTERVRELVHELADRRRPGGTNGKHVRWGMWLAIAASVVFLVAVIRPWSSKDTGPAPPPRVLGGSISDLSPAGAVADFRRFSWTVQEGTAAWFVIEVFDGDTGEPLLPAGVQANDPWWEPEQELRDAWPAEIRWTVTPYDYDGRPDPGAEARARRSL